MTDEILWKIRAVLEKGWGKDTAFRSADYENNPKSFNQCYVTARVVHEVLGWNIMINKEDGNNHYWNRTPDGREVDFTSDQAGGNGLDPFLTGKLSKRKFKPLKEIRNPRLKFYYERVGEELRLLAKELSLLAVEKETGKPPVEFKVYNVAFCHSFQWGYGIRTHSILLPNFSKINKQSEDEISSLTFILVKNASKDVNHEMLHKVLHEVVGYEAMNKFDRIDREKIGTHTRKYKISDI